MFNKHDYKGELEEVKENLRTLGRIESVEFVPGWYHESLPNFDNPLCLTWMDVDLYQSALDVLDNVYENVTQGGVIFSHEFDEIQVKDGTIKDQTKKNVLKAINDFFKRRGIAYKAKYLIKRTGIVVANTHNDILLSRDKQNVLLGLINDKYRILHENQMYIDEMMLAIDFIKKIPFVKPTIKYTVNNLLRRKAKSRP